MEYLGVEDQRIRIKDIFDRRPPECGGKVSTVLQSGENGYVSIYLRHCCPLSWPLVPYYFGPLSCLWNREILFTNVGNSIARDIDVGVEFNLGLWKKCFSPPLLSLAVWFKFISTPCNALHHGSIAFSICIQIYSRHVYGSWDCFQSFPSLCKPNKQRKPTSHPQHSNAISRGSFQQPTFSTSTYHSKLLQILERSRPIFHISYPYFYARNEWRYTRGTDVFLNF